VEKKRLEGKKKGRREFRPNFYYAGQTHGGGGLLPSLYCIRNARNETNVFRTAHGLQYDKLVCLIHPNSSADYALHHAHIMSSSVTGCRYCETVSVLLLLYSPSNAYERRRPSQRL